MPLLGNLEKHKKLFLIFLMMCCGYIFVQEYPNKPVKIFGHGTGSTADYLSRMMAQKLTEKCNQPVILDSCSGAGGNHVVNNLGYPYRVQNAGGMSRQLYAL